MTYLRLSAVLGGALMLVALVSCSDPSGVGLGVGENPLEGGDPNVRAVTPDTIRTETSPRVTGLNAARQNWRFLAGAVTDYGRVEADGYVDVLAPDEIPSAIATANADSLNAQLRLEPTYVHGDSTAEVTFTLHELSEEAEMSGATADTTFPVGAEIATYTRVASDSLITLPLPDTWVQDNAEMLRDTSAFGDDMSDFHGFRLSAPNASAVVGFRHSNASLRVTVSNDDAEAIFLAQKSFSNIRRTMPPSLPDDRVLLQDGIGDQIVIEWNRAQLDSLRGTPLNRASILIPVDRDSASLGESFVRPSPDYRVLATREDGAPDCRQLGAFALTESGEECGLPLAIGAPGSSVRVDERTAFTIFERLLVQDASDTPPPSLSEYRAQVVDRPGSATNPSGTIQLGLPSTVPVLVPTAGADTSDAPRIELTVTPL